MNPLRRFPEAAVVLPPAYFGSIGRYAVIAACGNVAVDSLARFDKRLKSTHRCTIADTRGPLTLTVPVAKPQCYRTARWADITVSPHGEWPDLHVTALESAYGRTPFFEFYIDRFEPLIRNAVGRPLTEFDSDLEAICCGILGIDPPEGLPQPGACRPDLSAIAVPPYWQVRAHKLGFIPGLSVLDLIFNLGPEAPLHLKRIVDALSLC